VTERVLIAGSGGQGIILTGKLLAAAALEQVPHVTFFPAYGAEVRGGVSNCQVVLSSEEIGSPICAEFDALLLMNPASAEFYRQQCRPGSLTLINASLCRPEPLPGAVYVRATEIAERLGSAQAANLVMLGAYLRRRPVVDPPRVERAIQDKLGRKSATLLELNLLAFRTGLATET